MTQRRGPRPVVSNSSPSTASRGRVRLSWWQYHFLGLAVGVTDQCEIGFGFDEQVLGSESRHGDPLRSIGKHVRKAQVIVVGRHLATLVAVRSQRGERHGRWASWPPVGGTA